MGPRRSGSLRIENHLVDQPAVGQRCLDDDLALPAFAGPQSGPRNNGALVPGVDLVHVRQVEPCPERVVLAAGCLGCRAHCRQGRADARRGGAGKGGHLVGQAWGAVFQRRQVPQGHREPRCPSRCLREPRRLEVHLGSRHEDLRASVGPHTEPARIVSAVGGALLRIGAVSSGRLGAGGVHRDEQLVQGLGGGRGAQVRHGARPLR